MKVIKVQKHLVIVLSNGDTITENNCTDEMYNDIIAHQDDEQYVRNLLTPKLEEKKVEIEKTKEIVKQKEEAIQNYSKSKYLTVFGSSIYIKDVSELTVPEHLARALFAAEQRGDKDMVQSYLNFWTLCCLNPDSRARTNLFWFLEKYGMSISNSGLFIAYRNVNIKHKGTQIDDTLTKFISSEFIRVKTKLKKSPKNYVVGKLNDNYIIFPVGKEKDGFKKEGMLDEMYANLANAPKSTKTVYTDAHTGTFNIEIGKVVRMDRDKCDARQDQTCSRGLHVAGRKWINGKKGSFGKVSVMCLVNPADVVAVPPDDNYGKMRTAAYYPIQVLDRDANGDVISDKLIDGFADDYLGQIKYDGTISTEDGLEHSIEIPNIPELSRDRILKNLGNIRKNLKKVV